MHQRKIDLAVPIFYIYPELSSCKCSSQDRTLPQNTFYFEAKDSLLLLAELPGSGIFHRSDREENILEITKPSPEDIFSNTSLPAKLTIMFLKYLPYFTYWQAAIPKFCANAEGDIFDISSSSCTRSTPSTSQSLSKSPVRRLSSNVTSTQ